MTCFSISVPLQLEYSIVAERQIADLFYYYFGCCFKWQKKQVDSQEKKQYYIYKNNNGYRIEYNDKHFYATSPIAFFSHLINRNFSFVEGHFALHASAVVCGGGAYVFAAPSGGGKTTLIAYLLEKGLKFLSDDCVLLNLETCSLYPYMLPIHLRKDSFSILSNYQIVPKGYVEVNDGCVCRYVKNTSYAIDEMVPIKGLFFLSRTDKENALVEVYRTEAITKFVNSLICPYSFDKMFWEGVFKATNSIKLFSLQYADMEFVSRIILNFK